MERLTLELEDETKNKLREVAEQLGFTVIHGPLAGQGSIAALVTAVANGELICVHKAAVDAAKKQK